MKLCFPICALLFFSIAAPNCHAKPATSRVFCRASAPITSLAYAPDGKTLASADESGRVILTDVVSGKIKLAFRYKQKVAALAYSPDGKLLAIARGREVRLLNPKTAAAIRVLRAQQEVGGALGFSADGQRLIVAEGNLGERSGIACSVWEVASGKQLQRHNVQSADVQTAALSPDGETFVAPNPEKFGLSLWSVSTGKRVRFLVNEEGEQDWPYIGTTRFSPDGKTLAGTGSYMEGPGHLTLWNVATGKPQRGRTFADYGGAVAWSPDSARIAVGTQYDTTYDDPKHLHRPTGAPIFDAATGKWQRSLQRALREITALAFSPDGRSLAIGSDDKTVRLWRAE